MAAKASPTPYQHEISTSPEVSQEIIQALIDQPATAPPPVSSCKKWLSLHEISSDLAQWGFGDDLGTYSQFRAFPVKGGNPTLVSKLGVIDTIPEPYISVTTIAVYSVQDDWLLVHSNLGWYWIYCPLDRLIDLDPGNYRKDHLFKWPFALNPGPKIVSNSQIHNPDDDGYVTYHEIERIKPCRGEILREQPSEGSKSLGPVKGEYLQLISFSGDWVKVIEPLDISELPNIVEGESCPLLRIRWNQNRTGWIRWRIPGPIPGTFHVLLRGREYFGYYD